MKIINTRLHGILDYGMSFALMLPWMTDYYQNSPATQVLASAGVIIALYSLMTDYEFGLMKLIPVKVHLALDVLISLFLIAAPWLIPMRHYLFFWPIVLGFSGLLLVLLSSARAYLYTARDFDITKP